MKHLKAFENYFQGMEEEMDENPNIYPSEEEEVVNPPSEEEEGFEGEYPEEFEFNHGSSRISPFSEFEHEEETSEKSTCPSCNCQECECGGETETFEAKKSSKEESYDKSELKNPSKADLNKDKKISGYEKARGKAIQKSMETKKGEKPSKSAQKDLEKKKK